MAENMKQTDAQQREMGVSLMMGLFFGTFGIAVIIAIFFTETFEGKITNLICGGLLLLCAAFAILKSRKKSNSK